MLQCFSKFIFFWHFVSQIYQCVPLKLHIAPEYIHVTFQGRHHYRSWGGGHALPTFFDFLCFYCIDPPPTFKFVAPPLWRLTYIILYIFMYLRLKQLVSFQVKASTGLHFKNTMYYIIIKHSIGKQLVHTFCKTFHYLVILEFHCLVIIEFHYLVIMSSTGYRTGFLVALRE